MPDAMSQGRKKLRPKEVADILGIKEGTLIRWRGKNAGPPWHKLSPRFIVYFADEVEAWIRQRRKGESGGNPAGDR